MTGDRPKQAKGKAKQVQGSAQQDLGHIQGAVRRPLPTHVGPLLLSVRVPHQAEAAQPRQRPHFIRRSTR